MTPKQKRRKWDENAIEMIFVGYEYGVKGYRCFDEKTNKITLSRNVRFYEDMDVKKVSFDLCNDEKNEIENEKNDDLNESAESETNEVESNESDVTITDDAQEDEAGAAVFDESVNETADETVYESSNETLTDDPTYTTPNGRGDRVPSRGSAGGSLYVPAGRI